MISVPASRLSVTTILIRYVYTNGSSKSISAGLLPGRFDVEAADNPTTDDPLELKKNSRFFQLAAERVALSDPCRAACGADLAADQQLLPGHPLLHGQDRDV